MSPIHIRNTTSDDVIVGGRGDPTADTGSGDDPHLHFGWGKRLPMIRQNESSECGLACLAMIADYYGDHMDLATLRQRFPLSLKGTTLVQLIGMAETLGLACRPLRLDLDELTKLQMPCILHWDLDHFVVLHAVCNRNAILHDPAVGPRRVRVDEIGPH